MNGPYRPGDVVQFDVISTTNISACAKDKFVKYVAGVRTDDTASITVTIDSGSGTTHVWGHYTIPAGYSAGNVIQLSLSVTDSSGTYVIPAHEPIMLVQHPADAFPNVGSGSAGGVMCSSTGKAANVNVDNTIRADVRERNGIALGQPGSDDKIITWGQLNGLGTGLASVTEPAGLANPTVDFYLGKRLRIRYPEGYQGFSSIITGGANYPLNLTSLTVEDGVVQDQLAAANTIFTIEEVDKLRNMTEAVKATDGSGAALATAADMGTLLGRMTAARAGWLDNLNVGGAVASHADILAFNQSASKHLLLQTVGQYERPESGTVTYEIECRTFSASSGAAVNADSTPTLTATGLVSGSLTANLSAATNPATGVYRWTYTLSSAATLEAVRFDVSATISAAAFTLGCYTQVADFVASTWTTTDRSQLQAIYGKLPAANIGDATAASQATIIAQTNKIGTNAGDSPAAATAQANAATAATQATTAATQATTAATQSTTAATNTTDLPAMLQADGAGHKQYTATALAKAPAGGAGAAVTIEVQEGVDIR